MLNERKGHSLSYDAKAGTARILVLAGKGVTAEAQGSALFDAHGDLVGVDVEPSSARRVIVMLGAHEEVARTAPARLTVARDPHGEVISVVMHGVHRQAKQP